MKTFFRFMRDEDGATLVEYALVTALVAVAAITATRGIGTRLQTALALITFT